MRRIASCSALAGVLALGACAVPPPAGPSVLAVPPPGKSLAQFQNEDATCRTYAQARIGPTSPGQAATGSQVGSSAVGTVLGAAAGAAIGAATGSPGAGAAIGAGSGLLLGTSVGAGNAQVAGGSLQRAYDNAYVQCMVANGDTVQQPFAAYRPYPAYGYGYPAYPVVVGPSVGFGAAF